MSSTFYIDTPTGSDFPYVDLNFNMTDKDSLVGYIDVLLPDDHLARDLYVDLRGVARASDPQTIGVFANTQTFHSQEFHISESDILKALSVTPGMRRVDFSFRVPRDQPTWYSDQHGEVKYWVRVLAKESGLKSAILVEKELLLNTELSLNSIPEAAESINVQIDKYDVKASFKVRQSGYVPGNTIKVEARITNRSSRNKVSARVTLLQVINYSYGNKRRPLTKTYVKVFEETQAVDKNESTRVWNPELSLPKTDVPATSYNVSTIVDINYKLQFEILTTNGKSVKKTSDIYIGTIPICRKELEAYIKARFGSYEETDSSDETLSRRDFSSPISPSRRETTSQITPSRRETISPMITPIRRETSSPIAIPVRPITSPSMTPSSCSPQDHSCEDRVTPTAPPYEYVNELPPSYDESCGFPVESPPPYSFFTTGQSVSSYS